MNNETRKYVRETELKSTSNNKNILLDTMHWNIYSLPKLEKTAFITLKLLMEMQTPFLLKR